MFKRLTTLSRASKQAVLLALDIVLAPLSLLAALVVASGKLMDTAALGREIPALVVMALLAAVLAQVLGLPRVQLKSYDISGLGRSALLGALLGLALAAMMATGLSRMPLGTPIILALMFAVLSGTVRVVLLEILLAVYRRTQSETRVLIYGAGASGVQLAAALKSRGNLRLMGFLDDNVVLHGIKVAGRTVHSPQRMEVLIARLGIDQVLLAMPSLSQPRLTQIARRVAALGVEVQALPSFAQLMGGPELLDRLAPVSPGALLGRQRLDKALDGGGAAYAGRVVMVSGAGGSIGSEICRQVLSFKPTKLVLLEASEFNLFSIERELQVLVEDSGVPIVPVLGSVVDATLVAATIAAEGVQVILHAAAYKHVSLVERNPLAGIVNNVFGTQVIAQAAVDAGIERFVLVSTDKAVRPVGVMGATKRMAELVIGDLARRMGPGGAGTTIMAMVRFGNVLGSSGSVVPIFQEQIARGGPVTVTDPEVTRYFMTIQEACRLVLWSGTMAQGGEIFVLDMGTPVRIHDLARQVIHSAGYTVRDADNPGGDIEIVTTGLRNGEKLHEELSISHRMVPTAHPKLSAVEEGTLTEFEVARALQGLRAAVDRGDGDGATEVLRHWLKRDIEKSVDPKSSSARRQ